MATATYAVYCDWDLDGDYADTGEDVTARVLGRQAVVIKRGKDQLQEFAPAASGSHSFALDGRSGDYWPDNAASPLYGKVLPGRRSQILATYQQLIGYNDPIPYNYAIPYNGGFSSKPLSTAFVDDFVLHPNTGDQSIDVPCLGSLSRLAGRKVSTALYSSITTAAALGHLLDAAGWPAGDRVIDTGSTTLDWWWLGDEDALSAAQTLLASEGPGAALYEDGHGRIVFEGANYRATAGRCTTSQITLSDVSTDEPAASQPFQYLPNAKSILNRVNATQKNRAAGGTTVVWTLGSSVTIAAGMTYSVIARPTDPVTDAITPLAATDFTVSAGSITLVTLNRTSGSNITITLTAGAGGATVTGLQLRAKLVSVTNTTTVVDGFDTSDSQDAYGLRALTVGCRAEMPAATMQSIVDLTLLHYQAPRATIRISLNNQEALRLHQILGREISDRITVVNGTLGLSADFFIEAMEHRIESAGKLHTVTFGCERVMESAGVARWDLDVPGTDLWANS